MNLKEDFIGRAIRSIVCMILSLAIALSLIYPGFDLHTITPANPIEDESIQEITVLKVGENTDNINSIVMPIGGAAAPEESENQEQQQGTEQGTVKEQNSDKKEASDRKEEQQETEDEKTEQEEPNTGDGEEGNEDGNQGEEGGELANLDIAMVMTWYKYGSQPKTIVCNPADTVSKDLNMSQLNDGVLKFDFAPTGEEAEHLKITGVSVAEGDSNFEEVDKRDEITLDVQEGTSGKNYTFVVEASYSKRNGKNVLEEYDTTFTYILKCRYAPDLELDLAWTQVDGSQVVIPCETNKKAVRTLNSNTLVEGSQFNYTATLTGALAENAQIISAEYRADGGSAVQINATNGLVIMEPNPNAEEKNYLFTFTVDYTFHGESETAVYTFEIIYKKSLDVKLNFTWLEGGSVPASSICLPEETVAISVKNNQLSAGSVIYEMKLEGMDADEARIIDSFYTSEGSGGGNLQPSGSLPIEIPEGYTYNVYTIIVDVMAKGHRLTYTIKIRYAMDISLVMEYRINDEDKIIKCEAEKTATSEPIYDDQLNNGKLPYQMRIEGEDIEGIALDEIQCYQSGNGKTITLGTFGDLPLLLNKEGKTGENTISVTAKDRTGGIYHFTINMQYKHKGENTVKIVTSLDATDVLINDAPTNLNVRAWSEDDAGNVVNYIRATGTDTKLIVKFDDVEHRYVSASGTSQEYLITPANPEEGDTNTHTLYIYAEDEFGNWGEKELSFTGQRSMQGQKIGEATIQVDMTVLGINDIITVPYDILSDESADYVIAKAVLGLDTGEPFGKADNTLGWAHRYTGRLGDGSFYLASLTPGIKADTLESSKWPGSSKEDILQGIDDRFCAGSGLATLWRCLYLNKLTKGSGDGYAFGEKDYTEGSGWTYFINGSYCPGVGLGDYYLHNGDVLTLRYTLAYGWDVGNGYESLGNTVGYCVTARNGRFEINHQYDKVGDSYVCKCCGITEGCTHEEPYNYEKVDSVYHNIVCKDCNQIIDTVEHFWSFESTDGESNHTCMDCKASEAHNLQQVEGAIDKLPTCTEPGKITEQCTECKKIVTKEVPAVGHLSGNSWEHDAKEHFIRCTAVNNGVKCNAIMEGTRGSHHYKYNPYAEWFECDECGAIHDPIFGVCSHDLRKVSEDCDEVKYHCDGCGYDMSKEGSHNYVDGICQVCGRSDGSTKPEPEQPDPEPEQPDPEPEQPDPEPEQPDPEPEQPDLEPEPEGGPTEEAVI